MPAAKRDIEFYKGDDYLHIINFQNSALTALNLTGRSYRAHVKRIKTQTSADVAFTCTVTNAAGGVLHLALTDAQTVTLSPGDYFWDLEETVGSDTTTIMGGKCVVHQAVTN